MLVQDTSDKMKISSDQKKIISQCQLALKERQTVVDIL